MTYTSFTDPTDATPTNFNSVFTELEKSGVEVFNVKHPDYGAVGDGVTNDTTAIQAALDAASDGSGAVGKGGIVFFPVGKYLTGKLTIPGEVTIQGVGKTAINAGSVIALANATNDSLFDMTGTTCYHVTARDLKLDGRSASQTGGTSHGINAYRATSLNTQAGRFHFENVIIKDFQNSGIYLGGVIGESSFVNVDINYCTEHGFNVFGADCYFSNCQAHFNQQAGFYITGVSNHFATCKAFFNGENTSGLGWQNPWSGWVFRDTYNNFLSACSAQENYRDGFHINGCDSIILAGCMADDNSITAATGAGGETYDGLVIDSSTNIIATIVCDDFRRRANGTHQNQRYGVRIDSDSSLCSVVASVVNHDAGNNYSLAGTGTNFVVVNGEVVDSFNQVVTTLANDATPSVTAGNLFKTGGTTTITDFDDGVVGQTIKILAEHAVTITDGTNILLNGSANFVMAAGDTLTLTMYNDQVWVEDARQVNL